MASLKVLALSLSIVAVVLFGVLALVVARIRKNKNIAEDQTTEFFLTARKSAPLWRIGWSFFASATGSWVVFAVPAFVVDPTYGAGYIGLISYAVFTGLPLVLVAHVGQRIRAKYPNILSWGDFAQRRFGWSMQVYVSLVVLLNMAINLAAEYTAIGSLFEKVVGVNPIIPILIVGGVTMIYTIVGGLYVSIVTDQYQGVFTLLLAAVTSVYLAVNFRLPDPRPPLPETLDANYNGWASIGTLGISLICATFFSDAVWQRVWASQDSRTLIRGASIGAGIAILVAFFFGFGGLLAAWSGYLGDDSNLGFFYLLNQGGETKDVWIVVLVVVLASIMNESAVDAYQCALTDTVVGLATCLGIPRLFNREEFPLFPARVLTLVINVPLIIVGTRGYNINQIYLIPNMVTSCSTLPLLMGLVRPLEGYVHGRSVLFGCIFALNAVMVYGYIQTHDYWLGIQTYFYTTYDYGAFLTALGASVVGVFLAAGVEAVVRLALGKPVRVERADLMLPQKGNHHIADGDHHTFDADARTESRRLGAGNPSAATLGNSKSED
ncbi:hypothetical protein BDZ88DRAFT_461151 [Geranomyces variabilis]|nr:hypothetical protein BDZ88DRAFT_461151 [Geranomyces variabilis]KAJ3141242.1 hypothetical protein HDU90_007268 [Geranomyces variabilis]